MGPLYEHRDHWSRHDRGNARATAGALGHDVAIANSRGPETIRGLAAEIGAAAVTAAEAARSGEIVVITIPERAVPDLPRDLFAGVPAMSS